LCCSYLYAQEIKNPNEFRSALANAEDGAVITFHPDLDKTILNIEGNFYVNASVTIDGENLDITIKQINPGEGAYRRIIQWRYH